jgi:hypothetical protein
MTASSELHAPADLLPEVRRLGGERSRSERFGEDTNLLPTGNRIPELPAGSLVTTTSYHSSALCRGQCCGRTLQTELVTLMAYHFDSPDA